MKARISGGIVNSGGGGAIVPEVRYIEGPQGPQGIQGPQGEPGPQGEQGAGFAVLDYYDTQAELEEAVTSPKAGDAYGIGTAAPYDIYIYSPTKGWVNNGALQGAKGETGPQGPAGANGYTPIKGTDYFTAADIDEVAEAAASMVDMSGVLHVYSDAFSGSLDSTDIPVGIYPLAGFTDAGNGFDTVYGTFIQYGGAYKTQVITASTAGVSTAPQTYSRRYLTAAQAWSEWGTGGGSSAAQYTGTLAADSWVDDGSGYYSQTITIAGLKETCPVSPDIDCEQSGTDADADIVVANAFDKVSFCTTGADSLTAKCSGDAPTSNIPVIVRVFE